MAEDIDKFLAELVSDPEKRVFIIDEIRPYKENDQFAIFGLVAMKSSILTEAQAEWYQMAIKPEFKEILANDVKGRVLYGSAYRDELEPLKNFFERWIVKSEGLYFMYTSQEYIKLNRKTSLGKIRFEESDGTVNSPGSELQPIFNFIKGIANALNIGSNRIEVILDEAEQNSSGEISVGKVKISNFTTFNQVEGGKPAKIQCPSEFRLIRAPDQSPNFQHALLFPDALCYLANKHRLLDGKDKVDEDLFHVKQLPLDKIIAAIEEEKKKQEKGDLMDFLDLKAGVERALELFRAKDSHLLKVDSSERSITHSLAARIGQDKNFSGWDIDCEFNRNLAEKKRLDGLGLVYPDLIIHKRGSTRNLLVIEAKKHGQPHDADQRKIRAYIREIGYSFGLILSIPQKADGDFVSEWWKRNPDGSAEQVR